MIVYKGLFLLNTWNPIDVYKQMIIMKKKKLLETI